MDKYELIITVSVEGDLRSWTMDTSGVPKSMSAPDSKTGESILETSIHPRLTTLGNAFTKLVLEHRKGHGVILERVPGDKWGEPTTIGDTDHG